MPSDESVIESRVEAGSPSRRRRLSPAERLPQILDAAFEEFVARGYKAARMDGVAERAAVAKGLLYHYFPGGKADLFKAVVRRFVQPAFENAEGLVAGFPGPRRELLLLLIRRAYALMEKRDRVILKLLIAEGDRFPELTEFYHAEVIERADGIIRAVIRSGVERGEFRPAALDWPPQVVMGPVLLASTWRFIFGERRPLDAAALEAAHLDMLMHGLLAG